MDITFTTHGCLKDIHTTTEIINYAYLSHLQFAMKIETHGIILSPSFQVLNYLVEFKLGQIEVYTTPGNYSQVNSLICTNIIIYHNK